MGLERGSVDLPCCTGIPGSGVFFSGPIISRWQRLHILSYQLFAATSYYAR
jgi:hypothetical protein